MYRREFHVNYISKEYLDRHHRDRENSPFFQLSYSDGSYSRDQDSEYSSKNYSVICKSPSFSHLTLDILNYLKQKAGLDTYSLTLAKGTTSQINDTEKQVLEEILNLHNDFVTPRRT